MSDETLIERSDGLVTVTLNRPHKKNAVNAANWADLDAVLREVAGNPADRALLSFEQAVEAEAQAQHITYTTADMREGITAFLERREPRFTG